MLLLYLSVLILIVFSFFFNNTATTEIYTLSLHDALPISTSITPEQMRDYVQCVIRDTARHTPPRDYFLVRSEEHTSELQSHSDLVCRLLLEKKKKKNRTQEHDRRYTTTKTLLTAVTVVTE